MEGREQIDLFHPSGCTQLNTMSWASATRTACYTITSFGGLGPHQSACTRPPLPESRTTLTTTETA
jgi:hypothetical protein